jgi:hypothetical protein
MYAAYYKFLLHAQLQEFQASFQIILDLQNKGFACPPYWIKQYPEMKTLPGYSDMLTENVRLITEAENSGYLQFQVHLPDGYSPKNKYPLILVLHGDGLGGDNEYQTYFWKPRVMLQHGMLVVYVQSSQVLYPKCYGWLKDYPTAKKDLKECFDQVLDQYSVDLQRVYISGFSGGAIMSTEVALAGDLPVRGWIALCPEIKPPSFTSDNLQLIKKRGVKAVFLEGALKAWLPDEQQMIEMFKEIDFPHQLIVNPGIGHAFPDDFEQKLDQALAFIEQ